MGFGYQASLRLIAESLRLVDRFGADPIAVRDVHMNERTLVVDVTARSTDSVRVKAEIAGVMVALSGLDVPTMFSSLEVQQFGVRAFDSDGDEIMWIVSSVKAAGYAARGQPIEWLSHSLVQENTLEYRRAQADRRTGVLEITLRDLTHMHAESRAGDDYLNQLWKNTSDMRRAARREGRDADDPRSVLDYSYLILAAWEQPSVNTSNGSMTVACLMLSGSIRAMVQLNRVRKKVAHHRIISHDDLRAVLEASRSVMTPIGHAHPELAQDFLVDRWEQRVDHIVGTMQREFQAPQVPERRDVAEPIRRSAVIAAFRTQLTAIETAIVNLDGLVVPNARRQLHDLGMASLQRLRGALSDPTLTG